MTLAITPNFNGLVSQPVKKGAGSPSLLDLFAALKDAVAETDKWCTIEDDLDFKFEQSAPPAPKVFGGKTPAQRIVVEGQPDIDIPAADYFYRTREEIKAHHERNLAVAITDEDRAAVEAHTTDLLKEFDRQEKARAHAMPRKLREAQRKLKEAHQAWTRAERALVKYKPKSMVEAAAMLEFVGADKGESYFQGATCDLRTIMRNAADAMCQILSR